VDVPVEAQLLQEQAVTDIAFQDQQELAQAEPHVAQEPGETIRHIKPVAPVEVQVLQEQHETDAIILQDHQETTPVEQDVAVEQEETIRLIKPVVREILIHQAIHALVEVIIQPEVPVRLAVPHTADRVEVVAHHTADRVAVAHQEVAVPVLQEVVPEVLTHLHARQEVIQADAVIQVVLQVVLQVEVALQEVADEVAEVEGNHL